MHTAPTTNFTPQQINFYRAALELHESQQGLGNIAAEPVVIANPATPEVLAKSKVALDAKLTEAGDLGFGFKKDGTPRKKANPVWLPNVKADGADIAPTIAAPATTTRQAVAAQKRERKAKTATIVVPATIVDDSPAWMSESARNGSSQHTRILAAELALFGAKSRKLTIDLTAKCATKGEASAHYKSLAIRVAAKKLDIRNGSANWKLAAAILNRAYSAK